jgi:hypothetical protein
MAEPFSDRLFEHLNHGPIMGSTSLDLVAEAVRLQTENRALLDMLSEAESELTILHSLGRSPVTEEKLCRHGHRRLQGEPRQAPRSGRHDGPRVCGPWRPELARACD